MRLIWKITLLHCHAHSKSLNLRISKSRIQYPSSDSILDPSIPQSSKSPWGKIQKYIWQMFPQNPKTGSDTSGIKKFLQRHVRNFSSKLWTKFPFKSSIFLGIEPIFIFSESFSHLGWVIKVSPFTSFIESLLLLPSEYLYSIFTDSIFIHLFNKSLFFLFRDQLFVLWTTTSYPPSQPLLSTLWWTVASSIFGELLLYLALANYPTLVNYFYLRLLLMNCFLFRLRVLRYFLLYLLSMNRFFLIFRNKSFLLPLSSNE